jgi:hypothetical protein
MNITSSSLSYLFIVTAVIFFIFFCYFKILVSNTSEGKPKKDKIIGNMKDPHTWREKNNRMSYIFLFWSVVSLCLFIYFKYFSGLSLVSLTYLLIYLVLIIISISLGGIKRKSTS